MNAINKNEVSMFKVGDHVLLYVNRKVFKIDHIYRKAVWLDSGKDSLDIVNIDDIDRIATQEEIAVGHRIDLETLRDCDTSPNCKKFDERVK